jgi:signal transduction histidine kinase
MDKEKANQDQIIRDLMAVTVDAINYDSLAQKILGVFADLFEAELCTLWRRVGYDHVDELILSASRGIERKPGDIIPTYTLNWGATSNEQIDGVTPWIAIRKQVCLANSYKELRNDSTKPWHGAHRGEWDSFQFQGRADEKFNNLLGLPIIYVDRVIGVLKVESTQNPTGFSLADQELAERLIPFVAITLQTMAVREQHEQDRQRVLRNLTRALLRVDATTFYQELVDKTAELLRADLCSLWIVDNERAKLKLGANYGVQGKERVPEYPLKWDAKADTDIEGLTPWVVIRKRSFFGEKHEDLRNHPAWRGKWDPNQWEGDAASNFGCLYAVPLIDVDEKPLGVLKIENRSGKPKFDAVDRATFDLMADFIALAIEFNSRLRSDIVYDFFHLLKQPVASTVMAFKSLREELSHPVPRQKRIDERLEMLANNLQTVRVWITNVYGLAAVKETPGEASDEVLIHDLLSDAVGNMRNLFPDFTCSLSDVDEDIALKITELQRKKINAIFFNVLDNSYKYSTEPRHIWAEARREGQAVRLAIGDNGRGIAPEDLSRVFEPYFTKGVEQWPDSMGLGLATVDRLLKELGWERFIESKVNEGTRFIILMPGEVTK